MANNSNRAGGWNPAALAQDLKTAWRLLLSPQVPTVLKIALPVAATIYWISPIDLLPGLPFDDIALMIFALKLFIQLAPDVAGTTHKNDPAGHRGAGMDGEVVDTTWSVVED